jgi:hypothetical protein
VGSSWKPLTICEITISTWIPQLLKLAPLPIFKSQSVNEPIFKSQSVNECLSCDIIFQIWNPNLSCYFYPPAWIFNTLYLLADLHLHHCGPLQPFAPELDYFHHNCWVSRPLFIS